MRQEMTVAEALEWIQQGNEAFIITSAGDVLRWRMLRGDLVIDRPPQSIYNQVTADARLEGQAPLQS